MRTIITSIFLLLFLCISGNGFAGNIDSLSQKLTESISDTSRIKTLIALSQASLRNDFDDALFYSEKAILLASKLGDADFLGDAYYQSGLAYSATQDYKRGIEDFLLAKSLYKKANEPKKQCLAVNRIGIMYAQMGSHYNALEKFTETLELAIITGDSSRVASVYVNFGNVYQDLEKFDQADLYYKKSLAITRLNPDARSIGILYNNLGETALNRGQFEIAKNYFIRGINTRETSGSINNIGLDYTNLGMAYMNLGYFDSSKFFLDKALAVSQEFKKEYRILHTKSCFANYYNAIGEYELAIEYATLCLEQSREMSFLSPQKQALENLYNAYSGLGEYEKALSYHVVYTEIRDSLRSGGDQFDLAQVETQFQLEDKIKEIERLKVSNDNDTTGPFWKQDWFLILVFFSLLGLLIIILEFRKKKDSDNLKSEYENIDYLRSTRILYLAAALFYTLLPIIAPVLTLDLYDPVIIRLVFSIVITIFYLGTFWSSTVRKNIDRITRFIFLFMIAHQFLLVYINSIALDHIFHLVIILSAITAVFKRMSSISFFTVFFILVSLTIVWLVDAPQDHEYLFLVVVIAFLLVSLIVSLSKSDLDRHLEFSNEVVNQADALVFIVDRKGDNIYTSQSVLNMLGHDPQDFKGHDWVSLLGIPKKEAIRIKHNLILIAMGTIEPSMNPYQMLKTKTGEIKWLSMKEKRLEQDRVLIIGVDVTEIKKIQDELAESELNFRQINETLADVFYLYNFELGKFEYISPNSEAIIGATPAFFYEGNNYTDVFVLEEDKERVFEARRIILKGGSCDMEYRIKVGSSIRWLREKSFPVFDIDKKVFKRSGLCQDITERKFAEEEIKKLSLIASNTDNFILMVNNENRVEWANHSFSKLTGYSEQEILGKLPLELISGELTQESSIDDISRAVFGDKIQMQCEMINYKKNHEIFYSSLEVTPLINEDGDLEKYFVIGSDITQRVIDQEQIKKIADQLDIVHAIEQTILTSESTEDIIYNTLRKTLDKLPVLRASLALFNVRDNSFYAYAKLRSKESSKADKREFDLSEFALYNTLLKSKTNHLQDLTAKKEKTKTDEILIAEGAKYALLSPLFHGDELIGSLNVCFTLESQDNIEHFTEITNEVANGLAIAIQQSQLKDEISRSNQAVTASIDYAKMIQQAYIPDNLKMDGYFHESTIINKPKDIVSGDFYWVGEYDTFKVIAVGDCTGHGVPGAFMTIIGISELNNIVNQRGVVDPSAILNQLNEAIIMALESKTKVQLKDGMDIGIFCFDTASQKASYAGARRPLWRLHNNEMIVIEGAKLSIGDTGDDFGIRFATTEIEANENDSFYIFSDGVTDQFGGEKNRKFSRKRLEKVLLESSNGSLLEQGISVEKALRDWQANTYQTDDILMVGFKVN